MGRSGSSAILLRASQAIPPVMAPSPMIAMARWRSSPFSCMPRAMPSAHESAVEACEFSTTSCTDSDLLG